MCEYQPAPEDKITYFCSIWDRLGYENFHILLDVGAGECPLKFATHVIDYLPYDKRGISQGWNAYQERFTKETWNESDFYDMPWNYPDKFFGFVNCVQTLEDIRDPIGLCKEMMRVGKAGFIETPNIISELSGLFFHHRWFVRVHEGKLQFLQKSPLLRITSEHLDLIKKSNTTREYTQRNTSLEWKDSFEVEEVYCKDETEYFNTVEEWVRGEL